MKEKKEEEIEIPFATYDINQEKKAKSEEHEKHSNVFNVKKGKGEIVIPLHPIKLNAKTLERSIFIVIILFLTSLLIFKPAFIFSDNPLNTNVSGAATKSNEEASAAADTTSTSSQAETATEPEQLSTPEATPAATSEPKDTTPVLSGKIKLIVGVIKSEKKDIGGKITSVGFVIDNQKTAFTPLVKIFVYDSDSREIYKTKPRETYESETLLGAGKKLSKVIPILAQFPDITEAKTVKLELYDADTEEIITDGVKVTVIR
tara:strand:+ start:1174 stop:1956 length:783 start_codon:yes stop_codon:yes gene_type:complete